MLYQIMANKWENKHYADWDKEKKNPFFDEIEEISITGDFASMDDAYLWLIENLPQYSIGAAVYSRENSDFMCMPAKAYYIAEHPDWSDDEIIAEIKKFIIASKEGTLEIIEED